MRRLQLVLHTVLLYQEHKIMDRAVSLGELCFDYWQLLAPELDLRDFQDKAASHRPVINSRVKRLLGRFGLLCPVLHLFCYRCVGRRAEHGEVLVGDAHELRVQAVPQEKRTKFFHFCCQLRSVTHVGRISGG